MSEQKKASRRDYMKTAGGFVAGAAVASAVWGAYELSRPPTAPPGAMVTVTETKTVTSTPVATPVKRPGEGMTFVFVGHWTAGPFGAVVQKGFSDACEELGAKGEFYMAEGDVSRQINYIREAVVKKVDGIITTIISDTAFDDPIREAIEAGVNVIAANADDSEGSAGNPRKAFIGQTFYTAGYSLGEYVAKKAVEAKLDMKTQRAAIFTSFPVSPWHAERGRGIRDGLIKYGVPANKIEDVDCISEEIATVERVQTGYLTKNRDIKLMFATDGITTDRFTTSAKGAGIKSGEVFFGGFDLTPGTVDGIVDGYILASVDQQQYLQGYFGVYLLYLMKKYYFVADIDTGKAVIDKTNVDIYKELSPKKIR
jgi:simple sugar transport system substrate-binding protein